MLTCGQVSSARASLGKRLAQDASPLDYSTTLRVIRDALRSIRPHPVVVSEGANTMDNARWESLRHQGTCLAQHEALVRA